MPDFAKALKQIRGMRADGAPSKNYVPDVPGEGPWTAGARSISFADQLKFLKTVPPADILPPGGIESTALGSHYLIRRIYPEDYFHGKVRLARLCSADLECLMRLMCEKGTTPRRDRIVFLDTETTGMQGGVGICPFLIGLGYFAGDEFHTLQYFIRDFDEEPSMLLALNGLLERFELVVTYNGAGFDIPLLETRFTLARLDSPFQAMSHFDLLFTSRRLWRSGHGSCRLVALEREMISFMRGPDVPGAMIPRAYFEYLQRRPSAALKSVFSHNAYDVISLAALTVHACDRIVLEPAELDEALDLYSLARVFENSPDWRRSIRLYEMAIAGGLPEPTRQKALENLSIAYRRAGLHGRAHEICAELMLYPEFSMVGYEGAAIYYERAARDYEAALLVLDEALLRTESKRWKALLKARWDRLQQKSIRYE